MVNNSPEAKYVPVVFGIKKIVISCVIEDDKVGIDDIEDCFSKLEDVSNIRCFFPQNCSDNSWLKNSAFLLFSFVMAS
jgi:hypothetical protein